MSKKFKNPQYKHNPSIEKRPILREKEVDFSGGKPIAWRFSSADKNGRWAWTNLEDSQVYKDVLEALHSFENYNPTQLRTTRSHPIKVDRLCKEAQKRLKEIGQDDLDELYSFRLTGQVKRVWCIQSINIMKILWWDPEHSVCPVEKKNT